MKNEKKTQARDMFFQGDYTPTEIADALSIPRRTLHHWIRENHWEKQKQCAGHMPLLLADNCYELIARFQEQLLAEDRRDIPITRHEVNMLHKLVITTNKLKVRATLSESMEMMGYFMDSVNAVSPEAVELIMPFVENYIGKRAAVDSSQFRPSNASEGNTTSARAEEPAYQQPAYDYSAMQEEEDTLYSHLEYTRSHHTPHPQVEVPLPDYKTRRAARPTYDDFIADLRRQEENLKHLYPPIPQNRYRNAA